MQEAGVVAAEQLDACTTVQQVWALGITRRLAVTALAAVSAQVWVGMPMDPRARAIVAVDLAGAWTGTGHHAMCGYGSSPFCQPATQYRDIGAAMTTVQDLGAAMTAAGNLH